MIRRDYILRIIAEFLALLNRLQDLRKGQLWGQATELTDAEFQRLIGADAQTALRMSETELLAQVIRSESTVAVRDKTLMLTALFKEAGANAAAQEQLEQSRAFYLKALDLLLDVLRQEDLVTWPEFVPKMDLLVAELGGEPELPAPTLARLMQHYERTGQFAKAEDALFAIVQADPRAPGLLEFGGGFYERLLHKPDAALEEGNLPRPEVETGSAEFRRAIESASS